MGEDFQDAIRSNERMPLYRADTPVGKKTVQVGREEGKREDDRKPFIASDGETFDKWSQALSSANDSVQVTRQHRGENGSGNFYSLILPILVVSDDTLWVVDYSNTGNSPPQKVQETTLFVDRTYKLQQGVLKVTHLHIFTRSGFIDFVGQVGSPSPAGLRERIFGFVFRQR
jgi:hypothetical protein